MSDIKKEKIDEIIKSIVLGAGVDKEKEDWLNAEIQELVNKVQFSDNYCPDCVERMFWKNGGFFCPKCGKQQTVILTKISEVPAPDEPVIFESQEAPPTPKKNPKRAQTIRNLANRLGESGASSPVVVDPQNGSPLPGATSKEINWV